MKFVMSVVALSIVAVAAAQMADEIVCPAGEGVIKGVCGKCPKGRYYDEYDLKCYKCNEGTFQPTEGIPDRCRDCPPNAFSMSAASSCISCPEGKVLLKNEKCGTCPPGTFYDINNTFRCKKCQPNTFQPYENIEDQCLVCAGDTNSDKGATKCTKCPAGKALMKNGKCSMCPPGTFYDKEDVMCNKCYVNTFQPDKNIENRCLSCSGDTHSVEGATKCTKCPQGTVLKKNGKCGTCPPGFEYYDLTCHKCPLNYFSKGKVQESCDACPRGSFAAPGSSKCFTCPFGESIIITKKGAKCGLCRPGYYYDSFEDGKCHDCGEGEISPGGIKDYYDCRSCKGDTVPNAERSACV